VSAILGERYGLMRLRQLTSGRMRFQETDGACSLLNI
jgi:hypothetical protein